MTTAINHSVCPWLIANKNTLAATSAIIALTATIFLTLSFLPQISSNIFHCNMIPIYGPIAVFSALAAVKLNALQKPKNLKKHVTFELAPITSTQASTEATTKPLRSILKNSSPPSLKRVKTKVRFSAGTAPKLTKPLFFQQKKTLKSKFFTINPKPRTLKAAALPPVSVISKNAPNLKMRIEADASNSTPITITAPTEGFMISCFENIYLSDFTYFQNLPNLNAVNKLDNHHVISIVTDREFAKISSGITDELPEEHYLSQHLCIPIANSSLTAKLWENLEHRLEKIFHLINTRPPKERVLIHSPKNKPLAAVVLVAYLMKTTGLPYQQCHQFLQRQAPFFNLDIKDHTENSFGKILQSYEETLRKR